MANYRYDWSKEYPDGCVKYSTRHRSKTLHQRLEVLATFLKMSTEMADNKALEIGVTVLEDELKKLAEINNGKNNQSG